MVRTEWFGSLFRLNAFRYIAKRYCKRFDFSRRFRSGRRLLFLRTSALHQSGNDRRVYTTGKERAHRYIGYHMVGD